MLVELAERVGPSLDWWLDEPFPFVLWSYYHLQEIDRRRGWERAMRQVEVASLAAIAFHDPKRLEHERETVLARARPELGPQSVEELKAWSDALSERLAAGRVLEDAPGMIS